MKRIILKLIPALIGGGIAYFIAQYRGMSDMLTFCENAQYLSDGCFVIGVMYTGIGLLVWISSTGFFDIFGYGFHSLLVLFTSLRRPENHESYLEYKERKQIKREKPHLYMLITGAAFIVLSIVFVEIFYSIG